MAGRMHVHGIGESTSSVSMASGCVAVCHGSHYSRYSALEKGLKLGNRESETLWVLLILEDCDYCTLSSLKAKFTSLPYR